MLSISSIVVQSKALEGGILASSELATRQDSGTVMRDDERRGKTIVTIGAAWSPVKVRIGRPTGYSGKRGNILEESQGVRTEYTMHVAHSEPATRIVAICASVRA